MKNRRFEIRNRKKLRHTHTSQKELQAPIGTEESATSISVDAPTQAGGDFVSDPEIVESVEQMGAAEASTIPITEEGLATAEDDSGGSTQSSESSDASDRGGESSASSPEVVVVRADGDSVSSEQPPVIADMPANGAGESTASNPEMVAERADDDPVSDAKLPESDAQPSEPEVSAVPLPENAAVKADDDPISDAKLSKRKRAEGRALLLTMEEVLKVKEKDAAKMSLGDGLQVHFEKNGHISFHFRLSENGKDTTRKLGEYPSMSLEQAREASKSYRAIVLRERNNRSKTSFEKMLVSRTSVVRMAPSPTPTTRKKVKCFASMKEANKFLNYLISDNGLDKPIQETILLLLLIPVTPKVLFAARWEDLDWKRNMLVIPQLRKNKINPSFGEYNSPAITVCLSTQAMHVIGSLKDSRWNDGYILVPHWTSEGRHSDALLNRYMKEVFPDFKIKPTDFKYFFRDMAVQNSGYSEEFIDDLVEYGSLPNRQLLQNSKISRIRALVEWWGDALGTGPKLGSFVRAEFPTAGNNDYASTPHPAAAKKPAFEEKASNTTSPEPIKNDVEGVSGEVNSIPTHSIDGNISSNDNNSDKLQLARDEINKIARMALKG